MGDNMEKSFWITMEDGVEVYVKKWYTAEKPTAILQLSHGMVEHINRYKTFAQYLVDQGIFVYGHDHRGHGKTGDKQGLLGYFSAEDGFAKTVKDLHVITENIKQEHPNTPLFLFGHSMGSFIARNYIQRYSKAIDGIILSGTGYFPVVTSRVGKQVAAMLPPKEASGLMNSLAFGSYNKKIKDKSTKFDWLSRDKSAVDMYIADPYTGYIPTASFFYDLMSGLIKMNNKKLNQSIRNQLPMLLLSGDADPVGNYGQGVWKTAHLYEQEARLEDITVMLFTDGRHELLNEINKDEVFSTINQWIQKRLN